MKAKTPPIPSVSVTYAQDGSSTRSNALGMRPMQERAYQKRGEQYLLIKSPPASGKSRALMFIALDKLHNQKLKQAIIVVPEKAIGASFHDEPLSQFGFWADWKVAPKWNLCDAPGADNGGKVNAVKQFLESDDRVLVCTHSCAGDRNRPRSRVRPTAAKNRRKSIASRLQRPSAWYHQMDAPPTHARRSGGTSDDSTSRCRTRRNGLGFGPHGC